MTTLLAALLALVGLFLVFDFFSNEPPQREVIPFADTDSLYCSIETKAYDDSVRGLVTGYNYAVLKKFAESISAEVFIEIMPRDSSLLDSLCSGSLDIVVLPFEGKEAPDSIILSKPLDSLTCWALPQWGSARMEELESWLDGFMQSEEHDKLRKQYFNNLNNPLNVASLGRTCSSLSPYDGLIKHYADFLGWDWHMLAAIIFQESKFHMEARSSKGASGLMQIMSETAKRFADGEDIMDPEVNIKTGTKYLSRLQKMFRKYVEEPEDLRRVTLAAYNTGEGHIIDCIRYAGVVGADTSSWEGIKSVFPAMADDAILEVDTVRLGKFDIDQVTGYVARIDSLYDAFVAICP